MTDEPVRANSEITEIDALVHERIKVLTDSNELLANQNDTLKMSCEIIKADMATLRHDYDLQID